MDAPSTSTQLLADDARRRIAHIAGDLYPGKEQAFVDAVEELVDHYEPPRGGRASLDEKDAFLIAYGDQVISPGEVPLSTLLRLAVNYGRNLPNIHVLPCFPYSSDDGFSVIDYLQIRPDLGSWDDIARLAEKKSLMLDAVLNHCSKESPWFKAFLADEPGYEGLATVVDPSTDLSSVTRPRTSPLLTPFRTNAGEERWVWTTFSDDQIDLNYADQVTALRVLEVVLEYARRGGSFLRIDAATYMWKELGTSCASLPNTHRLVQLLRAVLDLRFPQTTIITETNVPHEENISYLGENEAQLVYNFALPPLTFHTIATGNASKLTRWASNLALPQGATFFNFLASHDGIGVRGVEGILSEHEVRHLAQQTLAHGGRLSMRSVAGRDEPYELNISYIDALTSPDEGDGVREARFRLAHAIAFALRGVPAVYLHSLVGSRSAPHLVEQTGAARSINRERLDMDELERVLDNPGSLRAMVFKSIDALLAARSSARAFHPLGQQVVIDAGSDWFIVRRAHEGHSVLCVHNVTGRHLQLPEAIEGELTGGDILFASAPEQRVEPWGVRWYRLT